MYTLLDLCIVDRDYKLDLCEINTCFKFLKFKVETVIENKLLKRCSISLFQQLKFYLTKF